MYKVLKGDCTVNSSLWATVMQRTDLVTRAVSGHLQLRKPMARTDKRKNFYTVRICDLWNNLPANVRQAKSVHCFKSAYRLFKQRGRQGRGDLP
jgi:hypothetical protein